MTLLIISDSDKVAGWGDWVPGNVEPAGAGEELVGVLPFLEEIHELRELSRVLGIDVGSLTDEVLRFSNTANLTINCLASKSGIDDYRADD